MNPALARLPELLASHILLSAAALLLGLVISVPLAIAAARRPWLARIALGMASLIQTIPALALLALFYPILLGFSVLVGGNVPALGFLPALLALALYAVLPILRNSVTGLTGLDPAITEAADGVGMTPWQKLRLVEAPLAAPVAMAGIRTAAVWTIGAATLSTTVGCPSLGDLIFAGLQLQDWTLVLAGCVAAALLAVLVDALLGLVERGIARRRRWLVTAGLLPILISTAIAAAPILIPAPPLVTIGAKGFSEQYILARLIGRRLEAAGYRVRYRDGLGSVVIFRALAAGDVDVYVDYAGTLWANAMGRKDSLPGPAMDAAVGRWAKAEHGVLSMGSLGFDNAYAIAVRDGEAGRMGLVTLSDLAARSPTLRFGGDLEFLERPEWAKLKAAYPFRFAETRSFAPTFMYRAIDSGAVDAISAFSSDGRIAAQKLTVLKDTKNVLPGYDALLLVARRHAGDARFIAALRPLIGAISVETMRRANYLADRDTDKKSPAEVAAILDRAIADQAAGGGNQLVSMSR